MIDASTYTHLFQRPDGKRVLNDLKQRTFERVLGANATDGELRFLEGQRALVALILSLIKQGQNKGDLT